MKRLSTVLVLLCVACVLLPVQRVHAWAYDLPVALGGGYVNSPNLSEPVTFQTDQAVSIYLRLIPTFNPTNAVGTVALAVVAGFPARLIWMMSAAVLNKRGQSNSGNMVNTIPAGYCSGGCDLTVFSRSAQYQFIIYEGTHVPKHMYFLNINS